MAHGMWAQAREAKRLAQANPDDVNECMCCLTEIEEGERFCSVACRIAVEGDDDHDAAYQRMRDARWER